MSQQKDSSPFSGYSQCTKASSAVRTGREREERMRELVRGTKMEADRMDKVIEFVERKSVDIGLSK